MSNSRKKTRAEKIASGGQIITRKANNWQDSYGYHNFHLTQSQKELCNKINENTLTFVDSVAGTGKIVRCFISFCKRIHPGYK